MWQLYQDFCPGYRADYRLRYWKEHEDKERFELENVLRKATLEYYRRSEAERKERDTNEEVLNRWLQEASFAEEQRSWLSGSSRIRTPDVLL